MRLLQVLGKGVPLWIKAIAQVGVEWCVGDARVVVELLVVYPPFYQAYVSRAVGRLIARDDLGSIACAKSGEDRAIGQQHTGSCLAASIPQPLVATVAGPGGEYIAVVEVPGLAMIVADDGFDAELWIALGGFDIPQEPGQENG